MSGQAADRHGRPSHASTTPSTETKTSSPLVKTHKVLFARRDEGDVVESGTVG